jgi:hypothetical protein
MIAQSAKERFEKKLPPCPKCLGRLRVQTQELRGEAWGIVRCARKEACGFKVPPVKVSLGKALQGKSEVEYRKLMLKSWDMVFWALGREVKDQVDHSTKKGEKSHGEFPGKD